MTIGGMCKGSGMIHPNMGTMLGFITTDVCISKELLVKALKTDIEDTFNMVSVDGDTSTNDTVLIMANGKAGNPCIAKEEKRLTASVKRCMRLMNFLQNPLPETEKDVQNYLKYRQKALQQKKMPNF